MEKTVFSKPYLEVVGQVGKGRITNASLHFLTQNPTACLDENLWEDTQYRLDDAIGAMRALVAREMQGKIVHTVLYSTAHKIVETIAYAATGFDHHKIVFDYNDFEECAGIEWHRKTLFDMCASAYLKHGDYTPLSLLLLIAHDEESRQYAILNYAWQVFCILGHDGIRVLPNIAKWVEEMEPITPWRLFIEPELDKCSVISEYRKFLDIPGVNLFRWLHSLIILLGKIAEEREEPVCETAKSLLDEEVLRRLVNIGLAPTSSLLILMEFTVSQIDAYCEIVGMDNCKAVQGKTRRYTLGVLQTYVSLADRVEQKCKEPFSCFELVEECEVDNHSILLGDHTEHWLEICKLGHPGAILSIKERIQKDCVNMDGAYKDRIDEYIDLEYVKALARSGQIHEARAHALRLPEEHRVSGWGNVLRHIRSQKI